MKPLVITIDGPAGSGKSSIAKSLASTLSIYHLDSGALYRTYTWYALEKYDLYKDNKTFEEFISSLECMKYLKNIKIDLTFEDKQQVIKSEGKNLQTGIRQEKIAKNIKPIADNVKIRNLVNAHLKKCQEQYAIIVDGRDMGTEVFPDASLKFFLTANSKERAKRRYLELQKKNMLESTLEEIQQNIEKRDKQDMARKVGALRKHPNALEVDTSMYTQDEVYQILYNKINLYLEQ